MKLNDIQECERCSFVDIESIQSENTRLKLALARCREQRDESLNLESPVFGPSCRRQLEEWERELDEIMKGEK